MTLSELRTATLKWATRASVPDFGSIVKLTEADMNNVLRVRRMLATSSIGFSGTRGTLPNDFLDLSSIDLGLKEVDEELNFVPPNRFAAVASSYTGYQPSVFSLEGNSLLIAPAPSGSVDIKYFAEVTPLVNDDDTNAVLEHHFDIYFTGVLVHMFSYMRNDEEVMRYMNQFANAVTRANDRDTAAKIGMGSGMPTGFTVDVV